jgi:hypothetical protein
MIRCIVDFRNGTEWRTFKIRVTPDTTVAVLLIKLRKYIRIRDHDGVFMFFQYKSFICKKERLYAGHVLLRDIQQQLNTEVLDIKLMQENTFGAWNKGFVSAKIEKKKELFVGSIVWSWYGVTTWTEVEIFETIEECKSWILKERCAGGLTLSV